MAAVNPGNNPETLEFKNAVLFVENVPRTVAFYERAFGLKLKFMHPTEGYAELETGATLLSFLSDDFIASQNLFGGVSVGQNRPTQIASATQIAFVTRDMKRDWDRAIAAGATVAKLPEAKPWGITAGYLRDIDGVIVELTTPNPRY
jgi:lactoylglutathione lyase